MEREDIPQIQISANCYDTQHNLEKSVLKFTEKTKKYSRYLSVNTMTFSNRFMSRIIMIEKSWKLINVVFN